MELLAIFDGLLSIWPNFEPTLAIYNDIGNFFHLPNTEKYSSHLVTLQKGEAENTNILVLIILLYTVQRTLT